MRTFVAALLLATSAVSAFAGGPLITSAKDMQRYGLPGAARLELAWPLCANVGAAFGDRVDPFTGRPSFHGGMDIGDEFGLKVRASASGKVITAERRGPYGLVVDVDHGAGYMTRYSQLQSALVQPGMLVAPNDVIATVGSSGRSNGPHLHFEVWLNGQPKDPAKYLAKGACTLRAR